MARFISWPLLLILFVCTSFLPSEVLSADDEVYMPAISQTQKSEPKSEPEQDKEPDWPPPDTHVVGMISDDAPALSSITNYATLTELIAMISEDAMQQFADFFEPSLVQVEPFPYLWEFEHRRPSILGITLADQMASMLNNFTIGSRSNRDQYQPAHSTNETLQWVQGILQEMDGHLRIHISARNAKGARRSYVVNAQMSEPIYRALHTVPYRSRLHANNLQYPGYRTQ